MAQRRDIKNISLERDQVFRYPGARPYEDNEYHPLLFFGREDESREAEDIFLQNRFLIVEGPVASGKTSFLRAGLFPNLRRKKFRPIYARPADLVRGGLAGYIRSVFSSAADEILARIEQQKANSLKAQMEAVAEHAREQNQVPVLVIDQLEQIITLLKDKEASRFLVDLREMLREVSVSLHTAAEHSKAQRRAEAARQRQQARAAGLPGGQPVAPAAQAIAEAGPEPAAFGLILSVQADFIDVLGGNDYELPLAQLPSVELLPMSVDQAQRAIVKPGVLSLAGLITAPLSFDRDVVDRLLELLTDGWINREVEPLHIQLLCRDIEETIVLNEVEGLIGDAPVMPAFLTADDGLAEVLAGFYNRRIEGIESYWLRHKAQELCERGFITSQGKPQSVSASYLARKFGLSGEDAHQLLELRLIGIEAAAQDRESFRCTLAHPSLVHPILEARRRRLQKFEKIFTRSLLVLLFIGVAAFASFHGFVKPLLAQRELAEKAEKADELNILAPAMGRTAGTLANSGPEAGNLPEQGGAGRRPQAYMDAQAERLLALGEAEKALSIYEGIAEREPQHGIAPYRTAEIQTQLGRPDEAISTLERTRDSLREEAEARRGGKPQAQAATLIQLARAQRELAARLERQGDFTSAADNLLKAEVALVTAARLTQAEDGGQFAFASLNTTRTQLGELYFREKAYELAEEEFTDVLLANKDDAVARLGRARSRRQAEDFLGALQDYDRLIDAHPKRALYLYERAETHYQMEDYESCLEDCQKANLRDADNPLVYNLTAEAYLAMGSLQEAIDWFTVAIERDNRLFRAYLGRAQAHLRMGEAAANLDEAMQSFSRAVEDYSRIIELNPQRHSTYGNRGIAYKLMDRPAEALEDFDHLIQYFPDNEKAWYNRGNTFFDLGRTDDAIKDYTEAIKLRPSFARAHNNRGLCYIQQGDLTSAIEDFSRAIELDSTFASAYLNRGQSYLQLEQSEKAIKDFEVAVALAPDNDLAYFQLGSYQLANDNFEDALSNLDRAIQLNNSEPAYYRERALLFERLGDLGQAERNAFRAEQLESEQRRLRGEEQPDETAAGDEPRRESDPLDLFR